MNALLMKDYYTLIRQTRIFLIMIVIFAVMPGFSMAGFAIVYSAMLPITALAYDERSKWDSLAAMMPYTTKQIVLSKYILGYIAIVSAAVLALIAQYAVTAVQGVALDVSELISIFYIACAATIILAVSLPFMFRLGVEKGRILLFILIAAFAAGVMIAGDKLVDYLNSTQMQMNALTLIAAGVSIGINLISIMLSIRFYRKKAK